MPKLSFGIDGVGKEDIEGGFYQGDPPVPGTYKGKLKICRVGKIKKAGENQGKPRLAILVEITEGKYKGAGVWTGLNVTDQGVPYVNQWLNSLTDGSNSAKKAIQDAFWGPGPDVVKNGDIVEVKKIGRYPINSPEGEIPIIFTVKKGKDQDGSPRPEVGRFLSKSTSSDQDGDDDDDDDDGLVTGDDGDTDDGVTNFDGDEDEDGEPPF